MTDNVIVTYDKDIVTEHVQSFNIITEHVQSFNVITEGIPGPPGPGGLGGYDTNIIEPQAGDLITFSTGSSWVNIRRVDVSDGGNF